MAVVADIPPLPFSCVLKRKRPVFKEGCSLGYLHLLCVCMCKCTCAHVCVVYLCSCSCSCGSPKLVLNGFLSCSIQNLFWPWFPHQTWSSLAGTAVNKLRRSSHLYSLTHNCWVADLYYHAQLFEHAGDLNSDP